MTYYPVPQDAQSDVVGQLVMHNESGDVYRITEVPDGGDARQHYAIAGNSGIALNRRLRISVKAMWRDFSPIREG